MMKADFWKGKRVFVTGHTGFKGAWLVQVLESLGASVFGYALPPDTTPSLYCLAQLAPSLGAVEADVCDAKALAAAVERAQPQVVFHLAAQALVRRSYRQPVETFATNVMGTVHLLEAVRACCQVRAVVVVTSDKCYKNQEWHWGYRECEPVGGHDPYSGSKACAELVCEAYRSSFFRCGGGSHDAAIATARAGNVIGGGDWAANRLVPDSRGRWPAARPFPYAIPTPPGRGSTSWSPCTATWRWPRPCGSVPTRPAAVGTSGPRNTTCERSRKSSAESWRTGATRPAGK